MLTTDSVPGQGPRPSVEGFGGGGVGSHPVSFLDGPTLGLCGVHLLQGVESVADVHVLHLLQEDQGEPAGLGAVLLGQDEGVEGRWEAALFCLSAELETLRETQPRQSLRIEVAPLSDVWVVVENTRLVRPLQRIELLRQTLVQPIVRLVRFQTKIEIQSANNKVLNKSFVFL